MKGRTDYLRTVGQSQKVYRTSHGNTEREERKERTEEVYGTIMPENFPKLSGIKPQIQEAQ